jgi:hypothetical protein
MIGRSSSRYEGAAWRGARPESHIAEPLELPEVAGCGDLRTILDVIFAFWSALILTTKTPAGCEMNTSRS